MMHDLIDIEPNQMYHDKGVSVCPIDAVLEPLPPCCRAEIYPFLPPKYQENKPKDKELPKDRLKNHKKPTFENPAGGIKDLTKNIAEGGLDGAAPPKVGPLSQGISVGASALLDTPLTGGPPKPKNKPSKRRRLIKKGQKVVRRARRVFCKAPVLSIVLGRQLAKPTADALAVLANGQAVDVEVC